MLIEVLRPKDSSVVMYTTEPKCIGLSDVDILASAGYKFRVDGKILSKQVVKQYISQEIDITEYVDVTVDTAKEDTFNKIKIVKCITTGESFKNQSLAAKAYDIDPAQVSDSIKTGRPRSGYVFEYCYVDKEN